MIVDIDGAWMVLVAKQVKRIPSASVKRSWAPGCGRSFRTISRSPFGQPVRQSPASSASQAPSRMSPSGPTGRRREACSGLVETIRKDWP